MIALNFSFPIYIMGPASSGLAVVAYSAFGSARVCDSPALGWQNASHGCSSYLMVVCCKSSPKDSLHRACRMEGEKGREVNGQATPDGAGLSAGGQQARGSSWGAGCACDCRVSPARMTAVSPCSMGLARGCRDMQDGLCWGSCKGGQGVP